MVAADKLHVICAIVVVIVLCEVEAELGRTIAVDEGEEGAARPVPCVPIGDRRIGDAPNVDCAGARLEVAFAQGQDLQRGNAAPSAAASSAAISKRERGLFFMIDSFGVWLQPRQVGLAAAVDEKRTG